MVTLAKLPYWTADYTADTGTTRLVTLTDGSTVELDSGSAISVDYTNARRAVTLHQGEAYFTVAANPARPFDVLTGDVEIRALGTTFDVDKGDETIHVAVTEHAVRVKSGQQTLDKLASGNAISVTGQRLGRVTPQLLSNTASWRRHQLIFADRPLAEVITALNRYRTLPVLMLGSQIKNLAVTGLFDTQDTDTALQTIGETLAVKIHRLPGGLVLMTAV